MEYFILITLTVILIARYFGKRIWNKEDRAILTIDPNHPSLIDRTIFPIGSGKCFARNNDRHMWGYSNYLDEIPYMRVCTFCSILNINI